MGNYSASMLEAVLSNTPIYFLLEIELPSGTRRYSNVPVWSSTQGQYQGKIVSLGTMFRAASGVDGRLVYPRLGSIRVEDLDSELAEILELTEPAGSPVRLRAAATNVSDPDDWLIVADSFILDDWQQEQPLVWNFSFSFNDTALRSPFPRTPIMRPDFPDAVDPIIYTYSVLIAYGVHDSDAVGNKGMVPTFHVSVDNGWFGPWLGWITVERVYMNDAFQTVTTDYTIIHPIINGRQYTLIEFVTPPAAGVKVTADITGYRDGTDGAGDVLTGANALQHALATWVFQEEDWKSGAWPDPSLTPVHLGFFAEMQTWLEARGWEEVSRQLGGSRRITGEDLVNEVVQSWGKIGSVASIFTADGKIAVRPNPWDTIVLSYDGTRWLRYDLDQLEDSFKQEVNRHNLADKIKVQFLMSSIDSSFRWAIEVQDLSIGRNAIDDLDLIWSPSRLT